MNDTARASVTAMSSLWVFCFQIVKVLDEIPCHLQLREVDARVLWHQALHLVR